jgi:hypothetical protein
MKKIIIALFFLQGILIPRGPQPIDYVALLQEFFGFSPAEAERRAYIKPRLYPWTDIKLNLAAQAHNPDAVAEILQSRPNWHQETIEEALSLMDNPYTMCARVISKEGSCQQVKDLLVAEFEKNQQ